MEYRLQLTNVTGMVFVLVFGFGISVVTSAGVAARAYRGRGDQDAKKRQELTVKGYSRRRVRADLGVWTIRMKAEAGSLGSAYTALEKAATRVRAFLLKNGFKPGELALGSISTSPHHRYDHRGRETREVVSWSLDQDLVVTSADVGRIAMTEGRVTSLLREGLNIRSCSPQYTVSNIGEIKISILGAASADARVRATEIATNSGCQVAEVRRARMGVLQITRPNSTEVSSYGIYDTSTIEKDVSVVVTTTFGLRG